MSELLSRVIGGRYRVDAFVGKGGMADVYRVWDRDRSVHLAMKVLHADLAEDKLFLTRFRREARTLSELQHPNIVRFYGLEQADGLVFMLMDYVEGTTLREEIRHRKMPMPAERVLEIMRGVCAGLNYSHELGYVHCDIKPANILIDRTGRAVISDFGISRIVGDAPNEPRTAGTAAYMAPEQILGARPALSMDIYALGVVLYEVLTGGRRPFSGESSPEKGGTDDRIRWEQLHAAPPPLGPFRPPIRAELEAVVLRCLEKEPARRWPSVKALLGALAGPLLQAAISDQATTARLSGREAGPRLPVAIDAPPGAAGARRRRTIVWSTIGLAVIILVLTATLAGSHPHPPMPFTIRPYDASADAAADCITCRIPNWDGHSTPGSYEWSTTLPAGAPVLILLGWCASTQQTLDATWPAVHYDSLVIDNFPVSIEQLPLKHVRNKSNQPCNARVAVLAGWSRGSHQYIQTMHYGTTINDGSRTYLAGTYVYKFMVDVR